ncbi:MAG: hypothetical protein AAFO15_01050 [Pseudomonadota bacterium]
MSLKTENNYFSVFICCFIIITQYYEYAFLNFISVKLSTYFFHSKNLLKNLGYIFILYSIGTFIAKSCGSIIFGFIADIFGLNIAIKIPPFITLIASCIFIFSPSYNDIGYYAIILFIIARILFQISVSGEIDNTRLYIGKLLKTKMSESFVLMCKYIGIFLSLAMNVFIEYYNLLFQFGFVIAAICTFIAIFLRSYLYIIPTINNNDKSILNIIYSIYDNRLNFIYQIILYGLIGSTGYFHITFTKIYLVDVLKTMPSNFHLMNIFFLPFAVFLAGLIPFSSLFKQAISFMIINILILITIIYNIYHDNYPIYLIILSTSCTAFFHIPLLQLSKSLLPQKCEATFLSTSHSIGSIIFSQTTIVIGLKLWETYNIQWLPYIYPIIFILLGMILISVQYYYHNSNNISNSIC